MCKLSINEIGRKITKNKLILQYIFDVMGRKKYLIVMAAGSGTRMGAEMPKQFIELEGKAVLQMTIEKFLKVYPDMKIVTVLPEDYMEYWRNYCLERNFGCPQILVKGGITRFHSVQNALAKVPEGSLVAVHDAVRPLVSVNFIREIFEKAESVPALIPVIPCVDTMKVLHDRGGQLVTVQGQSVDRSVLYGAQTPQIFHSEVIKDAYTQAYDTSFTDDASVVLKNGKNLSYLIGERFNIKLTTQDDLVLAKAILSLYDASSR
jgi:2-C-methyl-D-erythritol 4-phosphate cytidylyltransferase